MVASNKDIILWSAGVFVVYCVWSTANIVAAAAAEGIKKRAIIPRQEQIAALFQRPPDIAVMMLNLIKFKPRAEYEDGRNADGVTGAEAYAIYDAKHRELMAKHGGKVLACGDAKTLVIGYGTDCDFDRFICFVFPSMEAYTNCGADIVELNKTTNIQQHQFAGVAYQQLIACDSEIGQPMEEAD